jgi:hypothetical protein
MSFGSSTVVSHLWSCYLYKIPHVRTASAAIKVVVIAVEAVVWLGYGCKED